MIKKITYLGVIVLLISSIISCEKDFEDIGTNIISNNAFETKDTILEISISPEDIEAVRADNIAIGALEEYLLGVYKRDNYKTIEASIIGQLGLVTNPKTEEENSDDDIDSLYVLDQVVLKIPYQATKSSEKNSDGTPIFRLDSVLGNINTPTSLKVFRSDTYLNTLNPGNPSEANQYLSNKDDYIELEDLTDYSGSYNGFFTPKSTDTMYVFDRTRIVNQVAETFKDTIKITNTNSSLALKPFLVIPLKKARMKELFWDKFGDGEFSTKEAFDNYFRGLILKVEGSDGAMIPLQLTGTNNIPSVEFYHTITRLEKKEGETTKTYKDTIKRSYSFPLSGIRNSRYKMTDAITTQTNSIAIQGTAGSAAKIDILQGTQLQDLKAKNWLINDASLTFYINDAIDTTQVPKRLFLYKQNDNGASQVKDAYSESTTFGGNLELSDEKPEKYTVKITDYISDLLSGTSTYNPPLKLRVYNTTDVPFVDRTLDTVVKTYNWNPRGVNILDNSSANGSKRAVLKISYTVEK